MKNQAKQLSPRWWDRIGAGWRAWMIRFNFVSPQPHHEATDLDRSMMRRALELAQQASEMDEVPVGAVVYQGDRILAEAFNRRECDTDPVAHAEILALQAAAKVLGGWRLNDCSMVVTLEPCAMCAGAIVNARLGRLIYGAKDAKMGAVESLYRLCEDKRMNHQPSEVIRDVLAPECRGLLREFFKQKRQEKKNAKR
jgi:tRNA(adenine34) deaminase